MNIIALLPSKKDHELEIIRRNAFDVLNKTEDSKRKLQADDLLTAIDKELEHRHLPGMIETFKEKYDGGFYGDFYLEDERNYKLAASTACLDLLEKEKFRRLINAYKWDELFERVKKLVNMTNLIQGSFERPKLFDAIRKEGAPKLFYPALYDCIHGAGDPSLRLGRFSRVLEELNLGKWTYATYFLFLSDPENCMFVKPDGLKKSLQKACYPLEYEPHPTAQLYAEILQFAEWLKGKLAELEPRDMIDVQSFIWHMGPTGIYSED